MYNLYVNEVTLFGLSEFEKCRKKLTYLDRNAPDEKSLQKIVSIFQGEDKVTKPQVAIMTIIMKIEGSKYNTKWEYVIKNLIILDRCVQNGLFLKQIYNIELLTLKIFQEQDQQLKAMKIDLFIKRYGHYIKQKASIYDKNNFFIKKELISHNLDTLANDMKDLCELFLAAQEVTHFSQQGILQYPLIQFVYSQLLYDLIKLHSIQSQFSITILDKMVGLSLEYAEIFRFYYLQFYQNDKFLSEFIRKHQFIQQFQISTINNHIQEYEEKPKGQDSIDEYIMMIKQQQENQVQNEIESNLEINFDQEVELQQIETEKIYKESFDIDQQNQQVEVKVTQSQEQLIAAKIQNDQNQFSFPKNQEQQLQYLENLFEDIQKGLRKFKLIDNSYEENMFVQFENTYSDDSHIKQTHQQMTLKLFLSKRPSISTIFKRNANYKQDSPHKNIVLQRLIME